jgi:dolichyl-phosphate beta-glucosyltransferase
VPAVVVVPCYNEADRLDVDGFDQLALSGLVSLLFVDDGSTDATRALLEKLAAELPPVAVLPLGSNHGKAEAVRRGMRHALEHGASVVGYYDADLATPPSELVRLVRTLCANPALNGVLGSRVARLGSHIDRRAVRHYTGRVFATAASLALGVAVYDTQCGAKVFRVTPELAAALERPFRSSWSFDVLLLQRLFDGEGPSGGLSPDTFVEVPLDAWRDIPGSKVRVGPGLAALADVVRMGVARRLAAGRVVGPRR